MSTGTAESTTITQSPAARVVRVVEDTGPNCYLLDTARFEHMQRIAMLMSSASLIPEHLKGYIKKGEPTQWYTKEQVMGNCFLIVNQAIRWGLDPFAVAPETYVVQGKLGFQGKLIAALVNSRGGLADRLSYDFEGKGDDLTITVSGRFEGETKPRTITLRVGDAKTTNDMWRKDPEQKLVYSGAIKWARRHVPEVILGVLTDDDLERMQEQTKVVEARVVETEAIPQHATKSGALAERLAAVAANKAHEASQDEQTAGTVAPTGTDPGETTPPVTTPGVPESGSQPATPQSSPAVLDSELIDESTYLDLLAECDTLAAVDKLSFDFLNPDRMPDEGLRGRCVAANRKRKDQIRTAAQMKKDGTPKP